jgi:hypothetical protein
VRSIAIHAQQAFKRSYVAFCAAFLEGWVACDPPPWYNVPEFCKGTKEEPFGSYVRETVLEDNRILYTVSHDDKVRVVR